jgi:predicted nucleic acid-binding protein
MSVECFIDTNVLVYAAGGRGEDEWKRRRAFELLEPATFGTSGQVLQEFFVTVTKKMKMPLAAGEAAGWVDRLSIRPVAAIDASLVKTAIQVSNRYRISYWDGAIVAAALSLDAPVLYTEDLNDGQLYDDVRVVNPFRQE